MSASWGQFEELAKGDAAAHEDIAEDETENNNTSIESRENYVDESQSDNADKIESNIANLSVEVAAEKLAIATNESTMSCLNRKDVMRDLPKVSPVGLSTDQNVRSKRGSIWSPRNRRLSATMPASPSCPDFGSLKAAHSRVSESGLTISEAKSELWKLRVAGPLLKRGFRHRKKWLCRWVVLAGRNLSYYEKPGDEERGVLRGFLELKKGTRVIATDSRDGTYGFEVVPPGITSSHAKKLQGAQTQTGAIPHSANSSRVNSPILSPRTVAVNGPGMRRTKSTVLSDSTPFPWLSTQDGASRQTRARGATAGTSAALRDVVAVNRESSTFSGQYNGEGTENVPSNSEVGWVKWLLGGGQANQNQNCLWRFRARTESGRQSWMTAIEKSIALVTRVEVGPTLCGVGQIYDHYRFGPVIDSGSFGIVRLAVAKVTGQRYAVRVVEKSATNIRPEAARNLKKEIKVMRRATRQVSHSGLLKLLQAYEDNFTVFLVTEFIAGRSVHQRVTKFGPFNETDASAIVGQVASALQALHDSGIILCDLRPDTLRFSNEWSMQVKLTNFANAIIFAPSKDRNVTKKNIPNGGRQGDVVGMKRQNSAGNFSDDVSAFTGFTVLRQMVGKPGFLAPEVVSSRKYSAAGDMWSLGCILFYILSGELPFIGPTVQVVMQATLEGLQASRLTQKRWQSVSKSARQVLGQLLNLARERRATPQQVLDSSWVKDPPDDDYGTIGEHHMAPRRYHARQRIRIAIMGVLATIRLSRTIHQAVSYPMLCSWDQGNSREVTACSLTGAQSLRSRASSGNSSLSAMSPTSSTPRQTSRLLSTISSSSQNSGSPPGHEANQNQQRASPRECRLADRSHRLTLDGRAGRIRAASSSDELNPAISQRVLENTALVTESSEEVDELLYSRENHPVRQQGPFLTALVQELESTVQQNDMGGSRD